MSDESVNIRITATNASKPGLDEARQGLKGLEAEAEKVSTTTKEASGSADVYVASLSRMAIGAAVGAAAGLATLALQAASSANGLVDLRTKTGLSLEELQRLEYVGRMTGQGVDVFANAVYRMGINVAKGGDQTKAAVEKMGISWEDFRQMSPEKQLQAIIDHLDFTSNAQERNATLAAIFGRSVEGVLVGLVQHYGTAKDAAIIMADESIERLAHYDDQIKKVTATLSQWTRQVVGATIDNLSAIRELSAADTARYFLLLAQGQAGEALSLIMNRQREQVKGLTADQKESVDVVFAAAGAEGVLSESFLWAMQSSGASREAILAYAKTLKTDVTPAQRDYIAALDDAKRELSALTPAQRAQLLAAHEGTGITKALGESFGLSETAIKLFKDQIKSTESAEKSAAKEKQAHIDLLERVRLASVAVSEAKGEEILKLKAQSVSEQDIAKFLGVTVEQVRQVIAADKDRITAQQMADKVLASIEERRLKALAQEREAAQKAGLERMALETGLHDLLVEHDRSLALSRLQGTERELERINQEEQRAIAAAKAKYGVNVDLFAQEYALIAARYSHERDLATETQGTIVERMRAAGIATRADLEESATTAKRTYEQMKASGAFSLEALEQARQKWLEAERRAADEFERNWAAVFGGALSITSAFGRELIALGEATGNQALTNMGRQVATMADITQKGMSSVAKFAAGDWVGGAIDGIGAIGSALGAVFGKSQGRKDLEAANAEIDKLRDKLVGPNGAYPNMQALDAAASKVGLTMSDTFGNQGKKGLEAVNERIAEFEARMQRVDSAMSKYNVQWHELGETARAAKLVELLDQLADEQEALVWAGLSSEAALKKQAKAYNDLLTEAMRTGQGIPPALLPTVLRLAEMGELTENNTRLLLGMAEDTRPGLKELEDAAGTLGIKVSDLGTRYDQLKFDEATDRYMKAFNTLARGGMDVSEAISKMSDETIEAINQGHRLGREFPESMRPILEAMREQGKLTDANGEKLEDLSGIKFSESLTDKMGDVIDKIKELIDAILGVPSAMDRIPRTFDIDVNFNGTRKGEWPGDGGGDMDTGGSEAFASGGIAYGPLHARIEPGRKEIIGDVDFMSRAIQGAFDRMGTPSGGSGGGAPITILMPIYLGTEQIDERIVRVGQDALDGQVWQVSETVLAGRPRF
jgi:DNA-binding CsgD family transcriptional regulator